LYLASFSTSPASNQQDFPAHFSPGPGYDGKQAVSIYKHD